MKVRRHVHLMAATGSIRTATFQERDHYVVPVVALVEGVIYASNAPSPELVLAEEFSRGVEGWNSKPVMFRHPSDQEGRRVSAGDPVIQDSYRFGTVFGARVERNKLMMDLYLDPKRAEAVGAADVLNRALEGEMAEVSVGVFISVDDEVGEWKGQKYRGVWRDIVQDHLAVLAEGEIGACSNAMGCGTPRAAAAYFSNPRGWIVTPGFNDRLNFSEANMSLRRMKEMLINAEKGKRTLTVAERQARIDFIRQAIEELRGAEDPSANTERMALDAALREIEPGFLCVDDFYPRDNPPYVIYSVMPADKWVQLRRDYSLDSAGAVVLADESMEVRAEVQFVPASAPVRAACGCRENTALEENPMTKEEQDKFDAMAAKVRALEEQSEADKKKAEEEAAKAKAAAEAKAAEELATLKAKNEELEREAVKNKEIVDGVRAAQAARKTTLVTALGKVKGNTFTKDELEAMPIGQLEKMEKLAAAPVAAPAFAAAPPVSFVGASAGGTETRDADDAVPSAPTFDGFNKALRDLDSSKRKTA